MSNDCQFHVVASLNMGGMERIVLDIAEQNQAVTIFVMKHSQASHTPLDGVNVIDLSSYPLEEKAQIVKDAVKGSSVYTHLIKTIDLNALWNIGITTIPVIHNIAEGWKHNIHDYNVKSVPYIIACGQAVKEDVIASGIKKPVYVIRHIPYIPAVRNHLVNKHEKKISLLMVGRIVSQKRYPFAVRVIAELRKNPALKGYKIQLTIAGPGNEDQSRICVNAILDTCKMFGLTYELNRHAFPYVKSIESDASVILVGPVDQARNYMANFDIFMNTSLWEGVSISTMEAIIAGVPVISSNVGGQNEIVMNSELLMSEEATPAEWANAIYQHILDNPNIEKENLRNQKRMRNLTKISTLPWEWMNKLAQKQLNRHTVFITGNMNMGGAQRSLNNLVTEMQENKEGVTVIVAGKSEMRSYIKNESDWRFIRDIHNNGSVEKELSMQQRLEMILTILLEKGPSNICFWNMDPLSKMFITYILEASPIRIFDVSPGPMMFKELNNASNNDGLELIGLSASRYFERLNAVVSKYNGGFPEQMPERKRVVIPNGVYPTSAVCPQSYLPVNENAFNILIAGRITESKYPEIIRPLAEMLADILPEATLTVVGDTVARNNEGPAWQQAGYQSDVVGKNVRFLPGLSEVQSIMGHYSCLLMISDDQGCPNTSLEASMQGIPVIANYSGGTEEQIIDGLNGFLISVDKRGHYDHSICLQNVQNIMSAILKMFKHSNAKQMGDAALSIVKSKFGMDVMLEKYRNLFYDFDKTSEVGSQE